MSCITIRNCCIGEGKPNVIIPLVEHTEAAILQKAAEFSTLSADCVDGASICSSLQKTSGPSHTMRRSCVSP